MTLPKNTETAKTLRFEEVLDTYGTFVWRTARYLGVQEVDLDDVVQEVFVVVHRRLGALEQPAALRAWLYEICVRVVANYRRAQRRRREQPLAAERDLVDHRTPDEQADRARERELVLRALDRLDADKRAVFVLFELEQLGMSEVAAVLRCPVKTAYSRLYAARREVIDALSRGLERKDP